MTSESDSKRRCPSGCAHELCRDVVNGIFFEKDSKYNCTDVELSDRLQHGIFGETQARSVLRVEHAHPKFGRKATAQCQSAILNSTTVRAFNAAAKKLRKVVNCLGEEDSSIVRSSTTVVQEEIEASVKLSTLIMQALDESSEITLGENLCSAGKMLHAARGMSNDVTLGEMLREISDCKHPLFLVAEFFRSLCEVADAVPDDTVITNAAKGTCSRLVRTINTSHNGIHGLVRLVRFTHSVSDATERCAVFRLYILGSAFEKVHTGPGMDPESAWRWAMSSTYVPISEDDETLLFHVDLVNCVTTSEASMPREELPLARMAAAHGALCQLTDLANVNRISLFESNKDLAFPHVCRALKTHVKVRMQASHDAPKPRLPGQDFDRLCEEHDRLRQDYDLLLEDHNRLLARVEELESERHKAQPQITNEADAAHKMNGANLTAGPVTDAPKECSSSTHATSESHKDVAPEAPTTATRTPVIDSPVEDSNSVVPHSDISSAALKKSKRNASASPPEKRSKRTRQLHFQSSGTVHEKCIAYLKEFGCQFPIPTIGRQASALCDSFTVTAQIVDYYGERTVAKNVAKWLRFFGITVVEDFEFNQLGASCGYIAAEVARHFLMHFGDPDGSPRFSSKFDNESAFTSWNRESVSDGNILLQLRPRRRSKYLTGEQILSMISEGWGGATELYKEISANCVTTEALDQFLCLALRTLRSRQNEERVFVVNSMMSDRKGSHWFTVYLRKTVL
eukprot:m.440672 g.440672  ORF g.440672 m.440672 type:complete len:741 (-) comp21466_c0_seq30:3877-6099(-)